MYKYQVQGNLFVQESRLCEFLIIIPLPEELRLKTCMLKEEFGSLYGSFNSQHSIPHITICDFLLLEHRAYDVYSLFKKRLAMIPSFPVKVENFASFASSNTIHLNVKKSPEFECLLQEINCTRKMLRLRKNYFQGNQPHITIAKNLSADTLEKAKEIFLKRTFKTGFTASYLEVLKFDFVRRRYHHFGTLGLGNEMVSKVQNYLPA